MIPAVLVIRWFDLGDGKLVPLYPGDQEPGCATFLGVTVVHRDTSEAVLRVMSDLLMAWGEDLRLAEA